MRNRGMLVGAIGAGKSTLSKALLGYEAKAMKTQSLTYEDWLVDTPGEYTENPMHYKSIMATAMEVTHVLYVQDATNRKMIFPPGFSTGTGKLPIGIVTKTDAEEADVERAVKLLRKVIPKGPVVLASAYNKEGLEEIKALVSCSTIQEMREYTEKSEKKNVLFHESLYK
ncbi:EutP/PduV family microcompartment system protein [Salimicrobium album]|uniref:Ethanolamine utilization protein EutP n=1 Tax=Salimicrobium album TaxID=50717 RepID=A0A1H3FUU5_9BACI|nr:EutP/PduV family microcompartment system protein [Salimicrobium album]SDX94128.1 ethanolamine utilization protein EutP [Salimicrobium album]